MIFQDIIFQNDILEYDFQRLTARVEVAATWPCFRLINLHIFFFFSGKTNISWVVAGGLDRCDAGGGGGQLHF